jgi:streptogramin lyase
MVFDTAGNLYACVNSDDSIKKITPAGVVSTFASGFNGPTGIDFDSQGNLYVSNQFGNTVDKITPAGAVSTFATIGTPSAGLTGVAIDSADNLYVGQINTFSVIYKITPGGVRTTWAQVPSPGAMIIVPEPGTSAAFIAVLGAWGLFTKLSRRPRR